MCVTSVTKKPTEEPFYKVDAAIGNEDLYRGAVDLSGPLNESKSVKYRLNLAAEIAGSFVDFYDRDRYQIAPVLSWQIGKNTDITFETEYSNFSANSDIGLPALGTILDNPNGEIPLDRFIPDPDTDREDTEFILASYNLEHRFSDNWRIHNAFQFTTRQTFISISSILPSPIDMSDPWKKTKMLKGYVLSILQILQ